MAGKPELDAGELLIARAYAKLSTNRQIYMGGIGPVPSQVVDDWMDRKRIFNHAIRDHFEAVIVAIDLKTLQRANRPPSVDKPKMDQKPRKPRRSKP